MMKTVTDTFVKYTNAPTSGRCLVFDMDDTLCKYDHELSLWNCDQFEARDTEHTLALNAAAAGLDVVIATARPSWTATGTFKWLKRHNVPVAAVYVKRADVKMPAHELKTGMLHDIQKTWEIVSFHDDSPFTIDAAREMGVNAVHVPGNEEFWYSEAKLKGWTVNRPLQTS